MLFTGLYSYDFFLFVTERNEKIIPPWLQTYFSFNFSQFLAVPISCPAPNFSYEFWLKISEEEHVWGCKPPMGLQSQGFLAFNNVIKNLTMFTCLSDSCGFLPSSTTVEPIIISWLSLEVFSPKLMSTFSFLFFFFYF